jgi:pimeloyl-ACP methyl ester carboxylesterase
MYSTRTRRITGKAVLAIMIAGLATVLFAPPASAWTVPPAPTLVDVNPSGNAGDWLIGAIPANYDATKPVIVFVQGLNGSANSWWGPTMYYGNNDMYAYAYNNGYRTAFVQFRDADGNAGSMWLNGSVLRQQLQSICQYFGVSKVNLVGHSKGGIDSQSAIVHYGAYAYVQNVFTLASPHLGSELADLCYSWWSWWLAALLGQRSDGTYVMQTSYMNYFRSLTNNRTEDAAIRYYLGAGTDWGPWFSAMWYGGNYLWFKDKSDGVVCLYSALGLPNGTAVFNSSSLNHDNIRMGSKTWGYMAPYLSSYTVAAFGALPAGDTTVKTALEPLASVAGLVRGGPIEGTARQSFAVESGVADLTVNCLVGGPATSGSLIAPDGTRVALAQAETTIYGEEAGMVAEVFAGARSIGASVVKPAAGQWTLELTAATPDAYLAVVGFGGGADIRLAREAEVVYSPGDWIRLRFETLGGDGAALTGLSVEGVVVATSSGRGSVGSTPNYGLASRIKLNLVPNSTGVYEAAFKLPGREGLYNLTIDLAGQQADGTALGRTLIVSKLVLKPEHRNADGLRALTQE